MASNSRHQTLKQHRVRDTIRSSWDRVKRVVELAPDPPRPPQSSDVLKALSSGTGVSPPVTSEANTTVIDVSSPFQPTPTTDADEESVIPLALGVPHGLVTTRRASTTKYTATTLERAKKAGGVAWDGLKAALHALEDSANTFPPLKAAISGLVTCLDVVQLTATNRGDYEELANDLKTMTDNLNLHVSELGSEDYSGSIARIVRSIETEVAHINKQCDRNKSRRILESAHDAEDVIKHYRRVDALFRQLQSDVSLRAWQTTDKQFKMLLLERMVPVDDARYDSSYSTTIKRRGCTPETREKVQAGIQDWVRDPDAAQVYWMNGMAGTGKTTIAYSLCEWLEGNQQLGASFFCSRASSSCRNVNGIVPTIAYQLARYSPAYRSALCKTLEGDPNAARLNVVRQFEKLIRNPMCDIKAAIPEGVTVVIDALDECEDNYGVRLVLETLLRLAANLPLKFFVTSRPEPAILSKMLSTDKYSLSMLHLHDIEQSIVEEDIKKYLTEALSPMSPPPSRNEIEQLATRAGRLFIYAATTVRYILPEDIHVDSTTRLKTILKTTSQSTMKPGSNKRYRELDALYTGILAAALDGERLEGEEIDATQLVLRTVVCAKEPMTSRTLASFLDLTEQQVSSVLQPLRSVLHMSGANGLVSTLHASFPDYMLDQSRSGEFHCDQTQHGEVLAHCCFNVMRSQLQFNICNLPSSFMYDRDVPDLDERIESCISSALLYACRYWGDHLRLAGASDSLYSELVEFLSDRLLFWMEVLNLEKSIVTGAPTMQQAEQWLLTRDTSNEARKYTSDARNFVAQFAASACTHSTPHIYLSALPFCPRHSSVYTHYWTHMCGLIEVGGTAMGQRELYSLATWMTNSIVVSVAFSPDGTRIVSGSYDPIVRVRNAYTGDVVAEFEGHTSSVNSVAFSSNGTQIVSGSNDRTIHVWDVRTGDIIAGPFHGHKWGVTSVAFSPDGTHIVSGSYDMTVRIRVWNVQTGGVVTGPLIGHSNWVYSVAFSPDGAYIVSGSRDCTIRVWDARTGNTVTGPFGGHMGSVFSVAYSPDGTHIVSGSDDWTVRIWDVRTGRAAAAPFVGHIESVESVAYSPDGACVVSGSYDQTIRVWDVRTGDIIAGPFKGHMGRVYSVAFSPDRARVVSGSGDYTIRLWDVRIGKPATGFERHEGPAYSVMFSPDGARIVSGSSNGTVQMWDACNGNAVFGNFNGHLGLVYSVAFSPDGTRIASCANDGTLRIWDAYTGNAITGHLEGHTDSVNSVAYSPDGSRIVSGSSDKTIRMWDAHTGDEVVGPFKGHTDAVSSVAYSPDGLYIASGSRDRTIRVWNARTGGAITGPLSGHTNPVRSVAFSPDGIRLASGFKDRTIRLWDARTGISLARAFKGHTKSVLSISFSPNGAHVVSGSSDCTVRVWDAQTGNVVAGPFAGHTYSVYSVAFSPDGNRVVSGSQDGSIRVLNLHSGSVDAGRYYPYDKPVRPVRHPLNDSRMISGFNNNQGIIVSGASITFQLDPPQSYYAPSILIGIKDFSLNNNGWVTTDNVPLFWVSPDLTAYLPYPYNTLMIGPPGSISIDYRYLVLGETWAECYSSNSPSSVCCNLNETTV